MAGRIGSKQCGLIENPDAVLYVSYGTIVGFRPQGERTAILTDEFFSMTTAHHKGKLANEDCARWVERVPADEFATRLGEFGYCPCRGGAPVNFGK